MCLGWLLCKQELAFQDINSQLSVKGQNSDIISSGVVYRLRILWTKGYFKPFAGLSRRSHTTLNGTELKTCQLCTPGTLHWLFWNLLNRSHWSYRTWNLRWPEILWYFVPFQVSVFQCQYDIYISFCYWLQMITRLSAFYVFSALRQSHTARWSETPCVTKISFLPPSPKYWDFF